MSDTVVGEYSASITVPRLGCRMGYHQNGGCFGYQFGTKYGELFATFRQWGMFGYKNGTINAPLLFWWHFSIQNRCQKCRNTYTAGLCLINRQNNRQIFL